MYCRDLVPESVLLDDQNPCSLLLSFAEDSALSLVGIMVFLSPSSTESAFIFSTGQSRAGTLNIWNYLKHEGRWHKFGYFFEVYQRSIENSIG